MIEGVVFAAFLAFCRIGGCFMVMPGLSSARVPLQIRLYVAVAVTIALLIHLWDRIYPFVSTRPDQMLLLVASELLIGVLIGLMARFYLLSLQFMGSAIAMLSGLSGTPGVSIEEPDQQSPIAGIISYSALLLLFVMGFHQEIIKALVMSYDLAPVSGLFDTRSALSDLADTISESFFVAIRLGSPFIAYAVLINLATGFINKLSPQVPVYFISLPFVITGALILTYFGIDTMLSLFADGFVSVTIGR